MKKAIAQEKGLKVSFFCVSLALIFFMLLFASVGVAGATVSYNATENTIYLDNGTNTLVSIYSEIGNPSVLCYDNKTNTFTLSANISGKKGVDADLVIGSATLVINSTADTHYLVKTFSDLTIENMTIKAANPLHIWKIWAYARWTSYSVSITDSDISGGVIYIAPNGYQEPSTPISISNNYLHDTTVVDDDVYIREGMVHLNLNAAINATVINNTFKNIHIPSGQYNGILRSQHGDKAGMLIDRLYVYNCSVASYGMVYFKSTSTATYPQVTNFEIKDCVGHGITGKEWGNVIISNGTITNITGDGIHLYHTVIYNNTKFWIWNVTIDGANVGIASNGEDNITADIFNAQISNVTSAYRLPPKVTIFYITNGKETDCTSTYYIKSDSEVRQYDLADISVIDGNSNAVEGATVTIEAINPDVDDCIINRNLESLTQTITITTIANGHTPLPDEDKDKTIALLRHRKTLTTDKTYSYNISASKNGKTASMSGLDIDKSWYRQDPDTPTKTVVCNIDTGECLIESTATSIISGTVTDTNGTTIVNATVTDGARPAITNETGGYTIANIPEGNYTVTASADGYNASSVDNVTVTADSTTTVNFELNPVNDTTAPTTTSTITPPPDETGWNNATPVVVTFFRSASNSLKYTNYSKVSATGPWTTVNVTTAFGSDAENVTDITESKFNVTVTDEGVTTTIWYYSVNDNSVTETVRSVTVKIDTTPPAANGTVSGTITSTNDGTGVSGVTVNLTLNSTGTVIASTTTDGNGDYTFTNVSPGEYTLTASKIRFWSNSMCVTVNAAGEFVTVNCALWLKGDLNNNGISADAGDCAMMKDASVGMITADWRYDLNTNGIFADAGDQAMMKDASVGKIELL